MASNCQEPTCLDVELQLSRADVLAGSVTVGRVGVVAQVEAGRLAAVAKQLKALKAEQFKKGQQLFSLKGQEQELTSDINGSSAQNRNLGHKLRKLDEKVSCCWIFRACQLPGKPHSLSACQQTPWQQAAVDRDHECLHGTCGMHAAR